MTIESRDIGSITANGRAVSSMRVRHTITGGDAEVALCVGSPLGSTAYIRDMTSPFSPGEDSTVTWDKLGGVIFTGYVAGHGVSLTHGTATSNATMTSKLAKVAEMGTLRDNIMPLSAEEMEDTKAEEGDKVDTRRIFLGPDYEDGEPLDDWLVAFMTAVTGTAPPILSRGIMTPRVDVATHVEYLKTSLIDRGQRAHGDWMGILQALLREFNMALKPAMDGIFILMPDFPMGRHFTRTIYNMEMLSITSNASMSPMPYEHIWVRKVAPNNLDSRDPDDSFLNDISKEDGEDGFWIYPALPKEPPRAPVPPGFEAVFAAPPSPSTPKGVNRLMERPPIYGWPFLLSNTESDDDFGGEIAAQVLWASRAYSGNSMDVTMPWWRAEEFINQIGNRLAVEDNDGGIHVGHLQTVQVMARREVGKEGTAHTILNLTHVRTKAQNDRDGLDKHPLYPGKGG